ncbi:hypothetical protein [Pseudalkalibacillus hwajinpoensis]|uniref:Uncharacterized protein n=1 Tax=Guptibacillus hwajinpoensis TaxID=208199 RepID=A0A4U1MNL5_9BACL|nr:hypothetical protein [Pseudalkalibacillus hwajinpoensis]TKD72285.1 hypothetical protein FBF83_05710 [Pseudalkalibacillus hwajinpoensis]
MKEFLAIFITIIATNRITEKVYEMMKVDYSLFEDPFILKWFLMDICLFFIIAFLIYSLLKFLIEKASARFS